MSNRNTATYCTVSIQHSALVTKSTSVSTPTCSGSSFGGLLYVQSKGFSHVVAGSSNREPTLQNLGIDIDYCQKSTTSYPDVGFLKMSSDELKEFVLAETFP